MGKQGDGEGDGDREGKAMVGRGREEGNMKVRWKGRGSERRMRQERYQLVKSKRCQVGGWRGVGGWVRKSWRESRRELVD